MNAALLEKIRALKKEGKNKSEISRLTQRDWKTVSSYIAVLEKEERKEPSPESVEPPRGGEQESKASEKSGDPPEEHDVVDDGKMAKKLFPLFSRKVSLIQAQIKTGYDPDDVERLYESYRRLEAMDLSKPGVSAQLARLEGGIANVQDGLNTLNQVFDEHGDQKRRLCAHRDESGICNLWRFTGQPTAAKAERSKLIGEGKYNIAPTRRYCAMCAFWRDKRIQRKDENES